MYFFGYGSSIKLRSSVLYHIGKRDKRAVYQTIHTNLKFYLVTAVALSALLFIFSHAIAGLFFSDAHMRSALSKMLKFFSLYSTFDCSIPIMSTMLRIFGMNFHASLIIFVCFGLLFFIQNYIYVVYLGLENFSPIVAICVCNVFNLIFTVYYIWKNTEKSLTKQLIELERSDQKLELLMQNKELDYTFQKENSISN